jgi:hypothetical protein
MTEVLLSGWAIAAGLLLVSALTLPRWFVMSLHRHRMWRHRDQIVDQIINGRLPDHPAVWEVLNDVERAIQHAPRMTLLRAYAAARSVGSLSPEARARWMERVAESPLDGLTPEQRELVLAHRLREHSLTTGVLLLGSWIGVATVLWRLVALITEGRRQRLNARASLARATDDAVAHTRLGRRVGRSANASMEMDRAVAHA